MPMQRKFKSLAAQEAHNRRCCASINRSLDRGKAVAYIVTDNSKVPWQVNEWAYGDRE